MVFLKKLSVDQADFRFNVSAVHMSMQAEDPGRWLFLPYPKPTALEDWVEFISELCVPRKEFFVVYASQSDEQPQGILCLEHIHNSGVFEIGHVFFAKRALRSSGSRVGVESVLCLLKMSFEQKGARRVQWRCHHQNVGSIRFASDLGFTKEGVFRNTDFYKGMNRDTVWFSIIDKDWPALLATHVSVNGKVK